jgi:hypothetical protein
MFLLQIEDKFQWLYIVLPVTGILLILFCVMAYFSKIGTRMRDKVQEFKFLGTELRISVITFFILVGLIFIFAWVYLSYNDILKNLKANNDTLTKLNASLTQSVRQKETEVSLLKTAQNKSISFNLVLEGMEDKPLTDAKSLTAFYRTFDNDSQIPLDITPTGLEDKKMFKITLNDVSLNTYILELVVKYKDNKWKVENFAPLSPRLTLKRFDQHE